MLIRPDDDPADVASTLRAHGFVGFKVYHVFASRNEGLLLDLASWPMVSGEFVKELIPRDSVDGKIALAEQVVGSSTTLFSRLLRYFEKSMSEDVPRQEWCSRFELFLNQGVASHGKEANLACHNDITYRLRVLTFLHGLIRYGVEFAVERVALERLYDNEQLTVITGADISPAALSNILEVPNQHLFG